MSIESILKSLKITNYHINGGIVDVEGDVNISGRNLKKIPIKFGRVSGGFYCYNNNLTSLQGAPNEVGREFGGSNNSLTSLQGAPNEVGGDFYCDDNNLTSLQGAPNKVGGDFYCYNNPLISLQGLPKIIKRGIYCDDKRMFEELKIKRENLKEILSEN